LPFTGTENIFEIKEKLDKAIEQNKDYSASNNTDALAKTFSIVPNGFIRAAFKLSNF